MEGFSALEMQRISLPSVSQAGVWPTNTSATSVFLAASMAGARRSVLELVRTDSEGGWEGGWEGGLESTGWLVLPDSDAVMSVASRQSISNTQQVSSLNLMNKLP